jgi:hypothetical protein
MRTGNWKLNSRLAVASFSSSFHNNWNWSKKDKERERETNQQIGKDERSSHELLHRCQAFADSSDGLGFATVHHGVIDDTAMAETKYPKRFAYIRPDSFLDPEQGRKQESTCRIKWKCGCDCCREVRATRRVLVYNELSIGSFIDSPFFQCDTLLTNYVLYYLAA